MEISVEAQIQKNVILTKKGGKISKIEKKKSDIKMHSNPVNISLFDKGMASKIFQEVNEKVPKLL